jgi:type IV secretory pathway TrbD component
VYGMNVWTISFVMTMWFIVYYVVSFSATVDVVQCVIARNVKNVQGT